MARFICVVCYQSLALRPGPCRDCGVDRLDLTRMEIREEVRAEAERRLERRLMRERGVIVAISIAAGVVVSGAATVALSGRIANFDRAIRPLLFAGMVSAAAVGTLLLRVYVWLRPDSAIATYARRRQRLSTELRRDVKLQVEDLALSDEALARPGPEDDPEVADINVLLRSMGARIDG